MTWQTPLLENLRPRTAKPAVVSDTPGANGVDVATFLENFEVLVEAGGGTTQLRQLALQLAFQGRFTGNTRPLVPAAVSGAHRPLSTARGRDAATTLVPGSAALAVGPAAMFIPEGWAWLPLMSVAKLESGHTPSRNQADYWDGGIPWIGIRDARDHNFAWIDSTAQTVSAKGIENSSARLLPAGTVCLSRTASVGYVTIMKRPMATSQDFVNWVCGERLLPEFLMQLLRCEVPVLKRFSKGAVHQTIYFPEVKAFHISLPPLAEQKRIVARVDQLMALIDDIEAKQTKKRELSARFSKASLGALTTAERSEEFDIAWKRVTANFDMILAHSRGAPDVKRTIRGLAYAGALGRHVGQWPISSVEAVTCKIVDCPHTTPAWTDNGIICLRTTNFRTGGLDLSVVRYVSNDTYRERILRLKPEPGDVVYSREGGILGIACVIPAGYTVCLGQRMMLMRPDATKCLPEYLALVLNAPQTLETVEALTGGTASPHLNVGDVRKFKVPLPSIDEQKRVVAKVQHLMKLCDDLESKLRRAEDRASKLVEAVVQEMVA